MRSKASVFFLLIGGIFVGAALFAEIIGLDKDPGWGRGRVALLIFGMMSIVIAYYYYSSPFRMLVHRIPLFNSSTARQYSDPLPGNRIRHYWFLLPSLVLVVLFYIWFASSGRWNNWESPTDYYATLAQGFLAESLSLPIQPDPRLLALDNPYDPSARSGMEVAVDLSLYKGKYYMYWGPVPALIPAMIYVSTGRQMGDMALTAVFACGIFLIQFLILLLVWDRYFHTLPVWTLYVAIFVCGLTGPLALLRHNYDNPRIYEAAIAGGQFFLLGGFWMALTAMVRPSMPAARLFVAGILWSLAVGTRQILAAPIAFMVILIAWLLLKTNTIAVSKIQKYISLGTPFVLGFAGLGWYNWARFDSITQTGLYYQLADLNIQEHYRELFSSSYLAQNLYNYLFNRINFLSEFPFVFLLKGVEKPITALYTVPELYNAQPIAGLFYVFPFVVFGTLALITIFRNLLKDQPPDTGSMHDDQKIVAWILLAIGGSSLISFVLLMIYFWAGMRFLGDFLPELAIFCSIGFWLGYRSLEENPLAKNSYALLGITLASASIVVNTLLAISTNSRLVNLLTRIFHILR